MKKLYVIPNCKECDEVEDWIKQQDNPVELEIIKLKKIDDSYMIPTDNGYKAFDSGVVAFPALEIGDSKGSTFILGKEGCESYLDKNYLHKIKMCPHLNKLCIERECEKFITLKSGYINEGGCSDYLSVRLLTQIAMNLNVRG